MEINQTCSSFIQHSTPPQGCFWQCKPGCKHCYCCFILLLGRQELASMPVKLKTIIAVYFYTKSRRLYWKLSLSPDWIFFLILVFGSCNLLTLLGPGHSCWSDWPQGILRISWCNDSWSFQLPCEQFTWITAWIQWMPGRIREVKPLLR